MKMDHAQDRGVVVIPETKTKLTDESGGSEGPATVVERASQRVRRISVASLGLVLVLTSCSLESVVTPRPRVQSETSSERLSYWLPHSVKAASEFALYGELLGSVAVIGGVFGASSPIGWTVSTAVACMVVGTHRMNLLYRGPGSPLWYDAEDREEYLEARVEAGEELNAFRFYEGGTWNAAITKPEPSGDWMRSERILGKTKRRVGARNPQPMFVIAEERLQESLAPNHRRDWTLLTLVDSGPTVTIALDATFAGRLGLGFGLLGYNSSAKRILEWEDLCALSPFTLVSQSDELPEETAKYLVEQIGFGREEGCRDIDSYSRHLEHPNPSVRRIVGEMMSRLDE